MGWFTSARRHSGFSRASMAVDQNNQPAFVLVTRACVTQCKGLSGKVVDGKRFCVRLLMVLEWGIWGLLGLRLFLVAGKLSLYCCVPTKAYKAPAET